MHYTGTIDQSSKTGEKGKQFDSSRPRGQTLDFKLGAKHFPQDRRHGEGW